MQLKRKLILTSIILVIIMIACVSVHAASSSAAVKIKIEGTNGGTVTITRADGSRDDNCRDSLSVPKEGLEYTFTHEYSGEDYVVYDYKIRQADSPRKNNYK